MEFNELKKKKKIGDYELIHELTGITTDNVRQHFYRGEGPHLNIIVQTFSKIVESRERLKENCARQIDSMPQNQKESSVN